MPISRRHLVLVAILVAGVACGASAAGPVATGPQRAAASPASVFNVCGLRLARAARGEIPFQIPAGGRALRQALAGGYSRCRLLRRDGSRFAELDSDSARRVLGFKFFRSSGVILHAADVSHATGVAGSGGAVKCDSSSHTAIGGGYWRKTMKWWIGATAKGVDKDKVVKAVRNAQSQWNNNINWCGIKDQASIPAHYEGTTSTPVQHDGRSTVDWGALKSQECSEALACAQTWYDQKGNPVESDIRFSNAYEWSAKGAAGAYDIQSVAAHEFGHVFQLDHVTNSSKKDSTNLMWPYLNMADTSGHKLGRGDATANNSHY